MSIVCNQKNRHLMASVFYFLTGNPARGLETPRGLPEGGDEWFSTRIRAKLLS